MGENPFLSEANAGHATEAMQNADFPVVQDIFLTETVTLAHVLMPAATFAEKDGAFTNTEGRVQRVREALEPVGGSKPDWRTTCQIAKRLKGERFDFSSLMEVMEEVSPLIGWNVVGCNGLAHQKNIPAHRFCTQSDSTPARANLCP